MLNNGDAETGPCETDSNVMNPPGWTCNGEITQLAYNNTFIYSRVNTIPGTAPGGCLFYGQISGYTSMWQTIDLTNYADPSLIDTGTVEFNLSAWLGGFINQNDRAGVSVTFLNQANQTTGSVTNIGPVTDTDRGSVTSFLFRQATGFVPVGARSATVLVYIIRAAGNVNDGYVDNVNIFMYQ
ncbi:unnamed protein product [Rotaria sp. Silwood1]|nr:unnamed protein product [Rotaria sp. Silwood1]CAF5093808.1 unnamed protein product [Rotaria sp. Silwood1]